MMFLVGYAIGGVAGLYMMYKEYTLWQYAIGTAITAVLTATGIYYCAVN